MTAPPELLERIREAARQGDAASERGRAVSELVREARGYRWVGLYRVEAHDIANVGWSGPGPPAHMRFPKSRGLCGEAVRRRSTIVVGDVSVDRRYLTTLGGTRSEIVVPVTDAESGAVAGILDVESSRLDAFGPDDRRFLESCAKVLGERWGSFREITRKA